MPEILRLVGWLVASVAGLYLLAALGAHLLAPGLLFPRPPAGYAPGPDYVTLTTPDGVTLYARHWPNPAARHTLLYFHGNGEDLGMMTPYIEAYVRAGFAVFAYDYRGYGHSGGRPSEAACYADARLVFTHVRDRLGVPPGRIILFGYSLGGGSATELARTEPVAGLVLESAFVSAYRVLLPWARLPGDKFTNQRKLATVACPVLVIHGTGDVTIPVWHGEALHAAARGPKAKLIVPGGGHGGLELVAPDAYWQALRDFAASLPVGPRED